MAPTIDHRTSDTSAMLTLVSAGLGFTFVPSAATARKPERVRLLEIADRSADQHFEFAWRLDNMSPVLANFVRELRGSLVSVG